MTRYTARTGAHVDQSYQSYHAWTTSIYLWTGLISSHRGCWAVMTHRWCIQTQRRRGTVGRGVSEMRRHICHSWADEWVQHRLISNVRNEVLNCVLIRSSKVYIVKVSRHRCKHVVVRGTAEHSVLRPTRIVTVVDALVSEVHRWSSYN